MVQGSQVSAPAHLDLRINPNDLSIWEPARSVVEQMEAVDAVELGHKASTSRKIMGV